MLEAPRQDSSPETGGYGLSGRSVPLLAWDRLVRSVIARAGEAAGRVAVARGDAPGVQLGADPADRSMSERGKRPGGALRALLGAGAPSAVAAGAWRRTRSSRGSHAPPGRAGKPSTGRRGPVSTQQRLDGRRSPVNTGAPLPDMGSGYFTDDVSCASGQPLGVLMESRMRWKSQVRFGGRRRGDHRPKGRHWRLAADPARARLDRAAADGWFCHEGAVSPCAPAHRPFRARERDHRRARLAANAVGAARRSVRRVRLQVGIARDRRRLPGSAT